MVRSATSALGVLVLVAGTVGPCDVRADDTLEAACTALKVRVAALDGLPVTGPPGLGWFCDSSSAQVEGYFVMALRSGRPAPYSNLMGWYAVEHHTHAVYEWNVAEMRLGAWLGKSGR